MKSAFELSKKMIRPAEEGEDPLETSVGQSGLTDEQRCHQAIIQNMTEVLKDKVQQIVNQALPMISTYQEIVIQDKSINPKQDQSYLELFLLNMLDKLADSKVSMKVQNLYMKFFDIAQLDQVYLLLFLFKNNSFANKKAQ